MSDTGDGYKVWAVDNVVYGPMSVATLIQWAEQQRVLADTWVYDPEDNDWHQAEQLASLRGHLSGDRETPADLRWQVGNEAVLRDELRQFSLFAGLSDDDLKEFLTFADLCYAPPEELIVRRGDPGDALYFVLSGGVRVSIDVHGGEKTLTEVAAGDFFGELVMFNRGTRSADVIAEKETRLLRVKSQAIQDLVQRNPKLAAPLLFAIGSAMAERITEDNRRLEEKLEVVLV